MKKSILKTPESFNGVIWGIASPENAYRISYFINKGIDVELVKEENSKNNDQETSGAPIIYKFDDRESNFELFLTTNKRDGKYILPEYKNLDYLLMLQGSDIESRAQSYMDKLKDIRVIQAIIQIPTSAIKSKNLINLD